MIRQLISKKVTQHDTTSELISATLQPVANDSEEPNKPKARVLHAFDSRMERNSKSQTWIKCGAAGRGLPNPMRQTARETKHLIVERGQASATEDVLINLERDTGRDKISFHYESVTKKWHEEQSDTNPGNRCEPKPIQSSSDQDFTPLPSTNIIEVRGQVDPKNPTFLTGKQVDGDLESGETTTKWSLRLVKPPKGK